MENPIPRKGCDLFQSSLKLKLKLKQCNLLQSLNTTTVIYIIPRTIIYIAWMLVIVIYEVIFTWNVFLLDRVLTELCLYMCCHSGGKTAILYNSLTHSGACKNCCQENIIYIDQLSKNQPNQEFDCEKNYKRFGAKLFVSYKYKLLRYKSSEVGWLAK